VLRSCEQPAVRRRIGARRSTGFGRQNTTAVTSIPTATATSSHAAAASQNGNEGETVSVSGDGKKAEANACQYRGYEQL
jgi:hypothetical protein